MTLAVLFGLVGLAWLVVILLNRNTGRETGRSDASAGYTGWLDGPGTDGHPRQGDSEGSTSDGASDGDGGGGDWGGGDGGGGDGGGDGGGGE